MGYCSLLGHEKSLSLQLHMLCLGLVEVVGGHSLTMQPVLETRRGWRTAHTTASASMTAHWTSPMMPVYSVTQVSSSQYFLSEKKYRKEKDNLLFLARPVQSDAHSLP